MEAPLLKRIPKSGTTTDSGQLLDLFLDYVAEKKLELYPAQEEAILELYQNKNVILNTPTGSGKSLVATALHFHALALGKRSYYTCPIKALVNEKFLALCAEFGADQVGMITGDATVNRDAPIICCTAEILSNMALRDGPLARVDDVIMDEFHYYSDRQRGVAWQIPLLTLPHTRFLLMSATLGDMTLFENTLKDLNGLDTIIVQSDQRPVPLTYEYRETPLHESLAALIEQGKAPVYLVNFTQRECAEEAQNLLSVDFCSKDEKKEIAKVLEGIKFSSPYGKDIQRLLRHGVGIHHAGLLPKYRVLVERLAQGGHLKVICGTDTLGVGVNVPIKTVLFTKLCKYDGEKTTLLSVRDFKQISGRAGRRGYDTEGWVIAQAPEHVIENLRLEQKAAGDAKKLRKIVKRNPPPRGYIPFNKDTFNKLIAGQPEPLTSRFLVTHAMLLNVLGRPENGRRAMQQIIRKSHESPTAKKQHRKTAFQLFRSLLERQIIEVTSLGLRVNVDLQQDFSLNQSLSLYLLDAVQSLDPTLPTYALDVLTLVESILENPDLILRRQLDRIKDQAMADMKARGIEYEERMLELEKLDYPKPNAVFIYTTFNQFAAKHPWVGQENIRPKSVAREMFETFQSFADYVRDYELQRIEGLLLRYLSEVYKTLVQNVPDNYKTEEVNEIIMYFGTMLHHIDSSLLEEWEKLRTSKPTGGGADSATDGAAPDAGGAEQIFNAQDITRDQRSFKILIRNEIFRFIRSLSLKNYADALEAVEATVSVDDLQKMMMPYYTDHGRISTDTIARSGAFTFFEEPPKGATAAPPRSTMVVQQTLCDPDGHNDWVAIFEIDLEKARTTGQLKLKLTQIRPMVEA